MSCILECGDLVSEMPACIFCGRSDYVTLVGGDKGICKECAENLTGALINTKRGKAESGHIIYGIGDEIREHEKKEHKRTDLSLG